MSSEISFTKDNMNKYLTELGKEFRKLNGKTMPAEIILVGGAAILARYEFCEFTYDIDALILTSSVMKQAINNVSDRLGLPNGWFNADLKKTGSYSEKLVQFSTYYKTFSNILQVRTIDAEFLIAMKLMSGRTYKNDLSDIAGILWEHQKRGQNILLEAIEKAFTLIYGDTDKMPANSKIFIDYVFKNGDYEFIYKETREKEIKSKDEMITNPEHRDKIKEESIEYVIKKAKEKRNAK